MKNSDGLIVRLRNGFSDRMGLKKENVDIQLTTLDARTRTALVNSLNLLWNAISEQLGRSNTNLILINILSQIYVQPVSYNVVYNSTKVFEIVNNTIMEDNYHDVLTVVEFIANQFDEANEQIHYYHRIDCFSYLNAVFEKEYVAYRFVNKSIAPISDDTEIESINESINSPYKQVNVHLTKAVEKLSNREKPDYENSIKESISAVECICSIIIGKAATLGSALDKLEKAGLTIHPSMKAAFDKLYGYTSDGTGIRHAGKLDGASATFEEAKFMLVSCSAFINYLVGVTSKMKI